MALRDQRPGVMSRCLSDAEELGRELQQGGVAPFRDATLKDRILRCEDENLCLPILRRWITLTDPGHVNEWLKQNTFDIDFESSLHSVNEWDDVLHVLCDPMLRLLELSQPSLDLLQVLERWWGRPQKEEEVALIWKTLLARSVREHCRRMWYSNVMPNTYRERYGSEPTSYFLKLAHGAARNVDGFSGLKEFLDRCPALVDLDSKSTSLPIRAVLPQPNRGVGNDIVFISYSHKDSDVARRLAFDLRTKGIRVWIDHREVSVGSNITTSIDRVLACTAAVVALLSPSSIASAWCNEEWSAALNAHLAGKSVDLIPINGGALRYRSTASESRVHRFRGKGGYDRIAGGSCRYYTCQDSWGRQVPEFTLMYEKIVERKACSLRSLSETLQILLVIRSVSSSASSKTDDAQRRRDFRPYEATVMLTYNALVGDVRHPRPEVGLGEITPP